jgi:hypothetical protein
MPGIQLSLNKWASDLIYINSNENIQLPENINNVTIKSFNNTIIKFNDWQDFHKNSSTLFGSLKGSYFIFKLLKSSFKHLLF